MKTTGLVSAVPTAFREDGSVDFSAIPPLAEHLCRTGCAGVFVNGTTGESMSLTVEEREKCLKEWRRVLPADRKLFAHVGHNCLEDAKRLACHASETGADAVAAVVPSFFKPSGIEGVIQWCEQVAAAVPDLPFYFYYMPGFTGTVLSVARFLEAAEPRIPNLAGVKYTYETLDDFMEALNLENGRFDLMWGRDQMLLAAWSVGARAATGSTFALAAPLYLELITAFERGDMATAQAAQVRSIAIIRALAATGNFFSALKQALRDQGVPMRRDTRLPLPPLSKEDMAACRTIAEKNLNVNNDW